MRLNRRILVLGGLLLALTTGLASMAHADVWYVPSSDAQPVPMSRSPVAAPNHVVPRSPAYVIANPIVYDQPIYVTQATYYEPVMISRQVVISSPVVTYRPLVSPPLVTREQIKSRPGQFEYEQKGKFRAFNGHRMKTYRYEYEVNQRPWGTRVKYDING